MPVLTIVTCCLYIFLTASLTKHEQTVFYRLSMMTGAVVVLLSHAVLLYNWIDVSSGQNLNVFNLLSQVAWLIALMATIMRHRGAKNLYALAYPFAMFSIILASYYPHPHIVATRANPAALFHILLSLMTLSFLCMAAMQALTWLLVDKLMRNRPAKIMGWALPSLESMEQLLHQLLKIGFSLLSVLVLSSLWFFHFATNALVVKTGIALLAWGIFATLITGHYYYGWRGQIAARWTLTGAGLLWLLISLSGMQLSI